MTTYREQHELAARAAGLTITWKTGHCKGGAFEAPFIGDQPWRPKDDDGDALRLAVKCQIDFYEGTGDGREAWAGYFKRGHLRQKFACIPHGSDPCAATRLAIFNAAVEIGKAMP